MWVLRQAQKPEGLPIKTSLVKCHARAEQSSVRRQALTLPLHTIFKIVGQRLEITLCQKLGHLSELKIDVSQRPNPRQKSAAETARTPARDTAPADSRPPRPTPRATTDQRMTRPHRHGPATAAQERPGSLEEHQAANPPAATPCPASETLLLFVRDWILRVVRERN